MILLFCILGFSSDLIEAKNLPLGLAEGIQLAKNSPKEARDKLLQIPPADPHFKLVTEELLKITYRLSDWPTFFSFAQFYRSHWKANETQEVQLLEPIALLRHCQDDLVLELTKNIRSQRPMWEKKLKHIESLAKTRFKGKATRSRNLSPVGEFFAGRALWPASSAQVNDPRKMKIKVENKCAS